MHGPQERREHSLKECPTLIGQLGVSWSEYVNWRQRLQYQKHHQKICYMCHVPQITDELHPTMTKAIDGVKCEYTDIVAPIAFGIYHEGSIRDKGEKYFNVKWESKHGFAEWLMGKPRERKYSNLIELFMWYISIR